LKTIDDPARIVILSGAKDLDCLLEHVWLATNDHVGFAIALTS